MGHLDSFVLILPIYSELKREKMWARLYLLPVFQAEMDREWMKWRASQIQEEKEIMKNVQGWNAGESPYHHQRWVPPTFDLDGNPVRAFTFVVFVL